MDQFMPLPKKKSDKPESLDTGLAPDDGPTYADMSDEHKLYTNPDPMKAAIQKLRLKIEANKDEGYY